MQHDDGLFLVVEYYDMLEAFIYKVEGYVFNLITQIENISMGENSYTCYMAMQDIISFFHRI